MRFTYPWGEWTDGKANTSESRLSRTTAVGMYPGGASAQGVLDLSGNVWEWCLNRHDVPTLIAVEAPAYGERALRGGSWNTSHGAARASARGSNAPDGRFSSFGVRVVCVSATR